MADPNKLSAELPMARLEAQVCAHNYQPIPVELTRALDVWVWDTGGRRYLDMMSAYSAVSFGHSHPALVAVLVEQAQRLAMCSRAYYSDQLGPFLKALTRLTGFDRALPMNTGAEAVETAIKAARRWGHQIKKIPADQAEIVVAQDNFHGRTTTIVGFSSEPAYRAGFGPFASGFRAAAFGDLQSFADAINERTCAVLVEPIQGEAGIVLPPDGWLRELRALTKERGVLLILDEVQSGLGRTGKLFAYQHEDIRPDGLILGKALGGGLLPVSAFVADAAVMDVFTPGSHGSTFGGNPLAAAVGRAALELLVTQHLAERSAEQGDYLLTQLKALASPLIRRVRGRGLWVGVEIDPKRASARQVCERLAEHGVLSKETHDTVIRFAPPLTIDRAALDWGIERFAATLATFEK